MTAEQERVRSYLLEQAERYDWRELWPRVMRARLDLLEALDGVSEEQARWRPGPDEWSIGECAQHVLRASGGMRRLTEHLARGERPEANADPPREDQAATLAELRTALIDDSAALAGVIERLPAEVDLETTAPHRMFGELNCRSWFLFQRVHDVDHMRQIRAVREADGFPSDDGPTENGAAR